MEFPPGATLAVAVLAHLPFPFAVHFDAGRIDHYMARPAALNDRQGDAQFAQAAGDGAVVRHGQGHPHQLK